MKKFNYKVGDWVHFIYRPYEGILPVIGINDFDVSVLATKRIFNHDGTKVTREYCASFNIGSKYIGEKFYIFSHSFVMNKVKAPGYKIDCNVCRGLFL